MGAALASVALVAGMSTTATASETPTAPETAAPAEEKVLRIATAGFVDSFNPFTSFYLLPTNTIRYMYENLVQYDAKDGSPTEGLAEKWETDDTGKVWTFNLQQDLTWSDDEPITAEDVVWTYTQMMENPAMGAANGSLVENFEKVEATDDHTVTITLKTPQAPNPGTEIPVVPEHVWSKIDKPEEFKNEDPVVGSGPFLLESYEANRSITLKANPDFWRGAPKIDKIQYIYYTNDDAQVQALRSGDVDLISGLTPEQFNAVKDAENVETNIGTGRRFTSLSLNPGMADAEDKAFGTGNEALKDVKVRQAIRAGLDIETLRKQVMQDFAQPATSFVPSAFPDWHLPDDDSVITGFDVDQAKSLLDEAGWKAGSDGIREKDGKKLELRLLTDADATSEQSAAKFIEPWMKDIGIAVKVESTDADTISERTTKGDFDMYFGGWSLNPDPDYQLGINTCGSRPDAEGNGGTTQDGYCNKEFDELYQQQHVELDQGKRQDIVRDALRNHYENVPSITLWYPNQLEAYRADRFSGFTAQPTDGGIYANQAGYWGYLTVEPGSGAGEGESEGMSTGLWIGIAVAVIVGGGGVLWALFRRKSADDRE